MRPTPLSERRKPGAGVQIPDHYTPPSTVDEFHKRIQAGETLLIQSSLAGSTIENLKLGNVNLHESNFNGCTFRNCTFDQTVFTSATFQNARIIDCNFQHCIMMHCDFFESHFNKSILTFCDCQGACFVSTRFQNSILIANAFRTAWFAATEFLRTPFSLNDLEETVHPAPGYCYVDLTSLHLGALMLRAHFSPTWDDPDMLRRQFEIAESQENVGRFLARCGAPQEAFTLYQTLTASPQHESVFISYSTADEEFARELYSELRKQGIDAWFAPHDMQGGETIVDQVTRAILEKSRTVLILSANSMESGWVRTEIRRAVRTERGIAKLFPIRISDYALIRDWELFDPDTGEDLAVQIRGFFIPDFREWRDPDSFSVALKGLIHALKKEPEAES